MSTPTEENVRIQSLITQTGQRLGTDAGFKAQYQADPAAALTGAGIPADAARRVLGLVAKAKGSDEVAGYDDDGYDSSSSDSSGGYSYSLDNPSDW